MSQSKKMSFVEACTNIAIGFAINFIANMVVLPICGVSVKVNQALMIGVYFTIISLTRTYCIRRWFNKIPESEELKEHRMKQYNIQPRAEIGIPDWWYE